MAAPIIDNVTVTPQIVVPGDTFFVKVDAHDPDQQVSTFDVSVTDLAGNSTTQNVNVLVADPLTYACPGLTQDANDPSLFSGVASPAGASKPVGPEGPNAPQGPGGPSATPQY